LTRTDYYNIIISRKNWVKILRILGVDYGTVRTGIAVSDEMGMMAHGVKNIFGRTPEKVANGIADMAKEYGVKTIVIGFPKNMNNTVGERGEAALLLKDILETLVECEIVMWDERLTTVSAHNALNFTNVSGRKKRDVVDIVAAEIILQGYLDFKNKKG